MDMHAKSFITSFFIDRRIRINKIQRGNALYITFIQVSQVQLAGFNL